MTNLKKIYPLQLLELILKKNILEIKKVKKKLKHPPKYKKP